jgi:hypothetical protein
MRVVDRTRIGLRLATAGLFACIIGCDGGVTEGTSNLAPTTPPPGRSAEDQAKARTGAYAGGKAAATKPGAAPKTESAK